MKKVFTMALGLTLVAGSMSSCKKGENDPGMSLTSRKARVAGEWTVSSSESTRVRTDVTGGTSETTTTTRAYDGEMEISTTVYPASFGIDPGKDTSSYNVELVFEKDGSYTQTWSTSETVAGVVSSSTYTSEGNWTFLGKSKSGELKKKEAIILSETSSTSNNTFAGSSFTSSDASSPFSDGDILMIDQLKSKEMIILEDSEYSSKDTDGDTYSSVTTGTMTLTHN